MKGKKIILGISGSIAAYKAASLTRLLVKAGAEVRVLMTEAAADFISPLTLSTLSKNEVLQSVRSEAGWNNHVELGLWADAYVIAPATANTLARLANGICDNILAAVYLSARCPVYFAPAMDMDMWLHPSTQRNLQLLQEAGNHIIDPPAGELASGLSGPGRLAEPEDIVRVLAAALDQTQDLANTSILITAGPTHEPLDPVRYLGNRSTGRMGIALAEAAARRGAQVHLVLGPSSLPVDESLVRLSRVETAQEMLDTCVASWAGVDVGILAAAVADYRPAEVQKQKIKKTADDPVLKLERTPDIAATLGAQKGHHQQLVGFALETHNELENARGKLRRKNFDFIVLNSLADKGAGFGTTTNRIRIVDHNKVTEFELKDKAEVAEDILDYLVKPSVSTSHS
ncbi:MAG: bifunctional phosphopantothenoylcysteine decarboxylase/phosphopantothenate--cysteine ligase CoaBC [Bacteroidota bacterium]